MTIIQAKPVIKPGVTGPATSGDNEVLVFDGITGKKIKPVIGLTIEEAEDVTTFKIATNILFDVTGSIDEIVEIKHTLKVLNAIVSGDLYISEKIEHLGDGNTYIRFTLGQIDLYAGGYRMLSCAEGAQDKVVVNPDSRDIDFRLNGDTKSGLIYSDAGYDYVSFGGGLVRAVENRTQTHTTNISENLIICDGTFTVNLNAILLDGQMLTIKNKGPGTITIDGASTQTIDGALTQTLSQWECITIISNKTTASWLIIADNR